MDTTRTNPIDMTPDEFRELGHQLVEAIAGFLSGIRQMPVTRGESPEQIGKILQSQPFPEKGDDAVRVVEHTTELLLQHSLLNGHPKFLGYITSSAAPIGALADLLASAVNPNVGANILSPMATAIEKQTIQWLAEFIGVSPSCAGILVSGGNMANFTGFLAGRTAKAPEQFKEKGVDNESGRMTVYCSKTTHTWIDKAVTHFGHGTDALRWIPVNDRNQMDLTILRETMEKDREQGCIPIMVIGTAGDVSTGVVDDLDGIADICETYNAWFHVDGAYGVPAAILPECAGTFRGLDRADSIALDPHKWLYAPLEAGCTLVKDPQHLQNAFSAHPEYYNFSMDGNQSVNFYEYGLQNSRGFRALKVWMSLKQIGRAGYIKLIREDTELARQLYELATGHPELEAVSLNLSITTFRFVPQDIQHSDEADYLNRLNEELLNRLQRKGEAFLSNAVVNGNYCLRSCVVNFRTTPADMKEIVDIILREGREMHRKLHAHQDDA